MAHNNIQYSEKYYDDVYEYRCVADGAVRRRRGGCGRPCSQIPPWLCPLACRHVVLPPEIAQHLPKNHLLAEVRACVRRQRRRCCAMLRTSAINPRGAPCVRVTRPNAPPTCFPP
jgi:hypothetical protein